MDNIEIIMVDDEEEEKETEEKKLSYMDSQLNYYIDKLNSKDKYNNVVKPNTIDGEKWKKYLKSVKLYSDEMKHTAEWIWVSALFDQTYFVFQQVKEDRKDLNEEAQKKLIKQILEKSFSTKSITQSNRKKSYELYEKFISLLISNCHESLKKRVE
ncbi:hypothetical protein C2G38_170836 [Gigaspora rosea]|uniref:Uncharacterized protein n=1 Tax=Gigaspora rosea TaxID=44941 RepID=A0A397UN46_9GLOM|nr:hypothetical protein C2G38_170836 [Gigaspora rosea]